MIDAAINHIASELNQQLMRTYRLSEDVVVVANILEQDGSVSPHVENKIIVSLVNIEKESVAFRQQNVASVGSTRSIVTSPPVHFNLYIMITSCFSGKNYQEGLKFISKTISFFQSQNNFDQQNSPGLDINIEKLILDIENLNISDLSNLWGILSGKYLPSVLYKVRMVTFDSNSVKKQTPRLSQQEATIG